MVASTAVQMGHCLTCCDIHHAQFYSTLHWAWESESTWHMWVHILGANALRASL